MNNKKELTDYIMDLYKDGKITGYDVAIMTDLIWMHEKQQIENMMDSTI